MQSNKGFLSFLQLILTYLFPDSLNLTTTTPWITRTTTLPTTTPLINFPNTPNSCDYVPSFKYMNTKTNYELVANLRPESDDFTLPGCDPIGIWHLSRHGARYPDAKDINKMNTILPKVKEQVLSSSNTFVFVIQICITLNLR